MKNRVNYLKIMVIVHGKSELCIARYIKSNLKIKMEIISKDKGAHSIQITSIMQVLNNSVFSNPKSFLKKYDDIEHIKYSLLNFRLFIIMDVDDCTEIQKNNFINGKMFKHHWLYKYITPVYNIKTLEDVMNKCNIPITKKNKNKYFEVFPVNRNELDIQQIKDFNLKLEKNRKLSNLSEFTNYCIEIAE